MLNIHKVFISKVERNLPHTELIEHCDHKHHSAYLVVLCFQRFQDLLKDIPVLHSPPFKVE